MFAVQLASFWYIIDCFWSWLGWDALSDKCQVDTIYTDYSSVFQSVNHKLLKHKLEHSYHLKGLASCSTMVPLIFVRQTSESHLKRGKTLDWKPVTSRVPEESLLAPLLFSMFINELPIASSSRAALCMSTTSKFFEKSFPQLMHCCCRGTSTSWQSGPSGGGWP